MMMMWYTLHSLHGGERTVFMAAKVSGQCPFVLYTGCPGGNVPDFGRMFLTLKYTDITQNTNIRRSTVTEIMAREKKCGLLAVPRTVPVSCVVTRTLYMPVLPPPPRKSNAISKCRGVMARTVISNAHISSTNHTRQLNHSPHVRR